MTKTIMIVEDDLDIQTFTAAALKNAGFTPLIFSNGLAALQQFSTCRPDLVLLDVQLPDIDGFNVCEEIRTFSTVPIIFISCLVDGSDIVRGLEIGGDDYVTKPFDLHELIARIHSNLRRAPILYHQITEEDPTYPQSEGESLTIGPLHFHFHSQKVFAGDIPLMLSTKEFQILSFLAQHLNQTFQAPELYKMIWGEESLGRTQSLKVHISNLRRKLEAVSGHTAEIQTVRGFGYQFVLKDHPDKQLS